MTDEPKIIVDEDWKSRVQAEKEALASQAKADTPAAAPTPEAPESPSRQRQAPPAQERVQIPAPTMPLLFSSLATQAMFALGRMADPQSGKPVENLEEARHIIDTLQLLEDKTKGNLSPEESALLQHLLYELRMEYVAVRDQQPANAPPA